MYAATPMMEAGRVWLPKNKIWADDLFSECMSFPNGSHDDQVDCLSMAVHYMKDSWNLTHPEDPSWEDAESKKETKELHIGEYNSIMEIFKYSPVTYCKQCGAKKIWWFL